MSNTTIVPADPPTPPPVDHLATAASKCAEALEHLARAYAEVQSPELLQVMVGVNNAMQAARQLGRPGREREARCGQSCD